MTVIAAHWDTGAALLWGGGLLLFNEAVRMGGGGGSPGIGDRQSGKRWPREHQVEFSLEIL